MSNDAYTDLQRTMAKSVAGAVWLDATQRNIAPAELVAFELVVISLAALHGRDPDVVRAEMLEILDDEAMIQRLREAPAQGSA